MLSSRAQVMTAVRSLKDDGVLQKGLIEQFEDANRWLDPLRLSKPSTPSPTTT